MAKVTNIEQAEPLITVTLSNGQTVKGTLKQLRAASLIADIVNNTGLSKEDVLAAIKKASAPPPPGPGHNSGSAEESVHAAGRRLKSFIERIERLNGEQAALADDIKEIFAEIKGVGFEPKIVRKIVRLRKMDLEKRREEEALLETYMAAVGME